MFRQNYSYKKRIWKRQKGPNCVFLSEYIFARATKKTQKLKYFKSLCFFHVFFWTFWGEAHLGGVRTKTRQQ